MVGVRGGRGRRAAGTRTGARSPGVPGAVRLPWAGTGRPGGAGKPPRRGRGLSAVPWYGGPGERNSQYLSKESRWEAMGEK